MVYNRKVIGALLAPLLAGSLLLTGCASDHSQQHKQECELLGQKVQGQQPLTDADQQLWSNCMKWASSEDWSDDNQYSAWDLLWSPYYYDYYYGSNGRRHCVSYCNPTIIRHNWTYYGSGSKSSSPLKSTSTSRPKTGYYGGKSGSSSSSSSSRKPSTSPSKITSTSRPKITSGISRRSSSH